MNIDRNTTAIVAHRDAAIDVNLYINLVAKSGEMFVDRIVENFEHHVVQAALVRVADVHAGALPDRFQTFQLVDLSGVVFLEFINR